MNEKTSIKDAIEACGVPHPEIDLIVADGVAVDFDHQLVLATSIDVYGARRGSDCFAAHRLQGRGITRFVADGHLGKLARDLRLLGIDVAYERGADDYRLVETAVSQSRALLTRDRRLLMHRAVRDGFYPRSQMPEEQTAEVIRRFDLATSLRPFTRCVRCNGSLVDAAKCDVLERLEPLTKLYYDRFRRCSGCDAVYWSGSHFAKLEARIQRIHVSARQAS